MPTHFPLADDERPLIAAALTFGDRLAELPFVTDEQRAAIRTLQDALRRLPDVTQGLQAEYRLEVRSAAVVAWEKRHGSDKTTGPCPPGYELSWMVQYWVRGGVHFLDIGGLHHPPERGDSPENEFAGDERELWYENRSDWEQARIQKPFWLPLAHRPWWQEWAGATENPAAFLVPTADVEVSVTLGPMTYDSGPGGSRVHDASKESWWRGDG